MADLRVRNNDGASRYEIRSDGKLAGFAAYHQENGEIQFTHTEIDPTFRGEGIGSALAELALTDAASTGDTLVPYCPFIAAYLREHEIPGASVRWPEVEE